MNVFMYILDTLADWEIGYLMPQINSGRYLKKTLEKPNIIKVGKNLNPIKTMGGILNWRKKLITMPKKD